MLATRGSKIYFKVKIHKNLWLHQTVVSLKIKSGPREFDGSFLVTHQARGSLFIRHA